MSESKKRVGPAGDGADSKKRLGGGFGVHSTEVQRRSWASGIVNAGRGPVPQYGSVEWVILPADDPRRLAAAVIAAECWHSQFMPDVIAANLSNELFGWAQANKRLEDEDYAAAVAAHREYWSKAAARRPGRYPGRRTGNVVPLRPGGGDAA